MNHHAVSRGEAMADSLIVSDPNIMMGKPTIKGTRITVELILEKLGAGETIEDVLDAHPRLTREGVLAALRFGAEALRADVAYPLPKAPV
jgi:uncharacterized protein (DUF433 family)